MWHVETHPSCCAPPFLDICQIITCIQVYVHICAVVQSSATAYHITRTSFDNNAYTHRHTCTHSSFHLLPLSVLLSSPSIHLGMYVATAALSTHLFAFNSHLVCCSCLLAIVSHILMGCISFVLSLQFTYCVQAQYPAALMHTQITAQISSITNILLPTTVRLPTGAKHLYILYTVQGISSQQFPPLSFQGVKLTSFDD